jgi:hypothetical protein
MLSTFQFCYLCGLQGRLRLCSPNVMNPVSVERETDQSAEQCADQEHPTRQPHTTSASEFSTPNQRQTVEGKQRRRRDNEDDEDGTNGDERSPKRPRTLLSPPQNEDDNTKFACPYRKRDPRKYCVRDWRSCALTPLDTVARVKYGS